VRQARASAFAAVVLLAGASAALALQQPGRTVVRAGPVVSLGLTHSSVAFGVGRSRGDCDHVELWNTDSRGLWRLGRKRPCGDLPVFSGIGDLGVATSRVVWVSYAGGNLTDWQLWTATPTRKTPRRLAFVERNTGDPAPVVVGPGTPEAIPYAVENRVTLLGDDGAPVFTWSASAEVRAVTSGSGPYGWSVAVLLATGEVVVLDRYGAEAQRYAFPAGVVRWIGLSSAGLLVQVGGGRVEIHRGAALQAVQLPANAIALDYAQGRLLYRVGQSFTLRTVASSADTPLLKGSKKHPVTAALDAHGLAWAQGAGVSWACGACIVS
jgi:hypothetical protein